MNSGGVLFVARPRFVFLLGLFDAPLPLLVAFTPAFILLKSLVREVLATTRKDARSTTIR